MTTHRLLWIPGAVSILLAVSTAASAQTQTPTRPPLFMEAPGSPFPAGEYPVSMAVGDFNGDAKTDLAIANHFSNNVTVLLGNGMSGFTEATGSPFPVGEYPVSMAVGDFNGDGRPDLATTNGRAGTVTVLLGNGTGGFTAAPGSPFPAGRLPAFVAVGDFNGDAKPDLAISNSDSNTNNVAVLLGNGTGGFAAAPGSPFQVAKYPHSVAVGDFNGDAKPDLVIANDIGNIVTVLLGNGQGGFTAAPANPFPAGKWPRSGAAGDFNGDGKPDLAIANEGSNNVTVLLGDGRGGFTEAAGSPFRVGSRPYSVAVGDFNGDGEPDLAIANNGSASVTVLLGNGKGGFTEAPGSPFPVGASPSSVAVGDFNGDAKPDLAIANADDGTITVLLNSYSGSATPTPPPPRQFTAAPGSPFRVGTFPVSVAVGDLNGDARPDLAIANAVRGDNVSVLLGNGTGGFTEAPCCHFTAGRDPQSVAVGDFNGDAKPDLAVANSGSANVSVLLGNGAGGFTEAPGSPFPVGSIPIFVTVGDFNGDAKPDLAVANSGSATVTVLLGNGAGGFTEAPGSPFPAGRGPASVAVGDLNGDAKPDLAIGNYSSNNVTVLLGNGKGGFTAAPGSPFMAESGPKSAAVGDFNGDAKPDLAIANYSSNSVTVLLGDGKGGFAAAPGSPFTVGRSPLWVAVGDFNGDAKPDLAIANFQGRAVSVLLGIGKGGFTAAPGSPFTVGRGPASVAVGDFNGDAKPDLAIANTNSSNVTVLLNRYSGPATLTPGKQRLKPLAPGR